MKTKQIITCAIILALLPLTLSADAAVLPAQLPWSQSRVDGNWTDFLGTYVSLAHDPITGKAFISYYDELYNDLRMAYQVPAGTGNCGTSNDWRCEIVDSEGDVGRYSSIDVTHVQPPSPVPSYLKIGISYFDVTNEALKYAEGIFISSPTWTIEVIEDSTGNLDYGEYSSVKFGSDHHPRIAYHMSNNLTPSYGAVKFAHYFGDGSGNCGSDNDWRCSVVDGMQYQPNYGTHLSLDMDYTDIPYIAYYDPVQGDLHYTHLIMYSNSTCTNPGWYCEVVDSNGDVGMNASIHAKDSDTDLLSFAYYDATEKQVRYAYPEPGHGLVSFVVDETGNLQGGISLAVDAQGYPIIAYMNSESYGYGSDLKIARPAKALGLNAGNCGHLKPYSVLPLLYWYCETIVSGGELTKVAEYASLSVDPSGLAAVAYYVHDASGRLMFTRQWFTNYLPLITK